MSKTFTSRNIKSDSTKVITSPTYLCLYNELHYDVVLSFLNKIDSTEFLRDKPTIIDLSGVEYVSAAAVTALFTNIATKQLTVRPNCFKVMLPENKEIKKLLRNTGFIKAINPGGKSKLEKLWSSTNFLCGDESNTSDYVQKIKDHSGREQLPAKLATAIRETFLNIAHHAYKKYQQKPPVHWWSYFQLGEDEHGEFLTTVIVDTGQSIPSSISPIVHGAIFKRTPIVDDSGYILYAMQESVTSTKIFGRGKGSTDMKKPVEKESSLGTERLFIVSRFGRYHYSNNDSGKIEESNSVMASPFMGTLIEWKLYF
jgi:anti-sigma regulatory factor (Ser/Thr protein kinase)/anti-anti-sigma regulatory factor